VRNAGVMSALFGRCSWIVVSRTSAEAAASMLTSMFVPGLLFWRVYGDCGSAQRVATGYLLFVCFVSRWGQVGSLLCSKKSGSADELRENQLNGACSGCHS